MLFFHNLDYYLHQSSSVSTEHRLTFRQVPYRVGGYAFFIGFVNL